jgi:uncharacterized protein YqjF (DUF2071 family)
MFSQLDYRPYPPPDTPFAMYQTWHDLLFAHWRVPVVDMRRAVPSSLPLDTFDGSAWVAVVPFRMSRVHARFFPSLPRLSAFPELNVRTYVTLDGRPGVYFFSLDAASSLAVRIARAFYHLPYFDARMACEPDADGIRYTSRRVHRGAPAAEFRAHYRPTGDAFVAALGSLEYFLTARYCLYVAGANGSTWRAEIHHPPWQLQPAVAEIGRNSMAAPHGIQLPDAAPHLLFARRVEVVVWLPEPVTSDR